MGLYESYNFFSDTPTKKPINQSNPTNVTKSENKSQTNSKNGRPAISYCALTAQGAINLTNGKQDWEYYETILIPSEDIKYWEMIFTKIADVARTKKNEVTFKGKLNKDAEKIFYDLGYNVWHVATPDGAILGPVIDSIAEKKFIKIIWSAKAR